MICYECGQPIGNMRYMFNNDVLCQSCFSKRPSKIISLGLGFNTHKDKLYEFNYEFKGQTFEIRGKGQWNKFMKTHNLHDDIKQSPRKPSEYLKQDYKPVPAKELANDMLKEAQRLGIQKKIGEELRRKIRR